MDIYTAQEQAYERGYENGFRDGIKAVMDTETGRPMIDRFTVVIKIASKVLPLLKTNCTPKEVYDAVLAAVDECPFVMISQNSCRKE